VLRYGAIAAVLAGVAMLVFVLASAARLQTADRVTGDTLSGRRAAAASPAIPRSDNRLRGAPTDLSARESTHSAATDHA